MIVVVGMDKKNIKSSIESDHNKSTGSKWIKFTAGAAIIASVFSSNPSYNQTAKYPTNLHKKNNLELVQKWNDTKQNSMEHQKIIMMPVDSIFLKYWQEEGLNIIRQHCIIEINAIRKKHKLPECTENDTLDNVSQEYAKYLNQKNILSHVDDKNRMLSWRLKEKKYTFTMCGETLASWQNNINELIQVWMNSDSHRIVILEQHEKSLDGYYTKVGLWYYHKTRVMNLSN